MAGSHLKFGKNEGPDESITEGCPGPLQMFAIDLEHYLSFKIVSNVLT